MKSVMIDLHSFKLFIHCYDNYHVFIDMSGPISRQQDKAFFCALPFIVA